MVIWVIRVIRVIRIIRVIRVIQVIRVIRVIGVIMVRPTSVQSSVGIQSHISQVGLQLVSNEHHF